MANSMGELNCTTSMRHLTHLNIAKRHGQAGHEVHMAAVFVNKYYFQTALQKVSNHLYICEQSIHL